MKYYSISSETRNRITNEIVGQGGFLVMVETEDEAITIMNHEIELAKESNTNYIDENFKCVKCSADEYVKYQEGFILRHAKNYYLNKLNIDKNLPVKEYNKLRNNKDNEALAIDYYQRRVSAFDVLNETLGLSKISAKEFLDSIERLASCSTYEAYQKALEEILKA